MPNFPISKAEIVGLFMESAAWGVQLVTAAICIYTVVNTSKASKRTVNALPLVWAILLLVVGTIDVAFLLYRNVYAFTIYEGEGGSELIFSQLSDYVTVLRTVCNFLAVLIADAALIHRTWIVYGQRWIYVIPSILIWLAGLACAAAGTYYCATFSAITTLIGAPRAHAISTAFVVISVVLNIIATSLILYRINQVHRKSSLYFAKHTGSCVSNRMQWPELTRILVESAFVYTLTGVIFFIVNFAESNALYPVSDFYLQLAGIQFDLIIIRVGRGIAIEHVDTTVQTIQFKQPPLNRSMQQSGAQVIVTEDTGTNSSIYGLRSFSDVESKPGGDFD